LRSFFMADFSHDDRIAAWWAVARRDFKRRSSPPSPAVVADLADALRATFPGYLRDRFVLPPALVALVAATGGDFWQTLDEWHELWGTDTIVRNLALEVRVHDDRELIESAGPWVQFARSGDHHHFFLSCDATASHVGHVIEGDDDHPWLENGLLRGLGRAPLDLDGSLPLTDWLDRWRG
jgi:hypothetical protein